MDTHETMGEPKPKRPAPPPAEPRHGTVSFAPLFAKDGDQYVVADLVGFADSTAAEAAGAGAQLPGLGLSFGGQAIRLTDGVPGGPYLEVQLAGRCVWLVGGPTISALVARRAPELKGT